MCFELTYLNMHREIPLTIKAITNQWANHSNYYLLVIGIDNYDHCSSLSNAVNDGKALIEVLTTDYHFSKDEEHLISLFNDEATRKNIYKELKHLQQILTEEDSLIIFFSGHGCYDEYYDGFWIPVDAKPGEMDEYIENSSIIKFIKHNKARHILIMADSCFSGSLFLEKHRNQPGVIDENIRNLWKQPSRWAISSGRLEPVSDGPYGGNSPFTHHLLEFFREQANPWFTTFDLLKYVREATTKVSPQIPRGEPLKAVGDKGGEFLFVKKIEKDIEWEMIQRRNSIEGYLDYLVQHPHTPYLSTLIEAIDRLKNEEETCWKDCLESHKVSSYLQYIEQYPKGEYVDVALKQIDIIKFNLHPNSYEFTLPPKIEVNTEAQWSENDIAIRHKIYTERAQSGKTADIDFLMSELDQKITKRLIGFIDFALKLVSKEEGVRRLEYYLFYGSTKQKQRAIDYFKKRGHIKILQKAVRHGIVGKEEVFKRLGENWVLNKSD